MFSQFISEYGTTILYTFLTAIFGYLGIVAKNIYQKYINTKEKKQIAEDVVKFTEQVYKDLHGDEKLNKALEAASEILAEKGIQCSELEMRVLIEAALASFNDAFNEEEVLPESENVDDFKGDEFDEPIETDEKSE